MASLKLVEGTSLERFATQTLVSEAIALNNGDLPVGVAVLGPGGEPLGVAALKAIPSHAQLSPWAAAGYVVPARRGQGLGALLLRGLLPEARRLAFADTYCATGTSASPLSREGWCLMDAVVHEGQALQVFRFAVPRHAASP